MPSNEGEFVRRIVKIEKWLRRLESLIIRPAGSGNLHNAVTVTDTATINLTLTGQNIQADYIGTSGSGIPINGWEAITGTFTYASATTINVSSGAAAIYNIGDKLRYQNNDSGTWLYGYIVAIADTLLTVAGDVVPNAILTDAYYSKIANPLGFSHWFSYTVSGISATNVTKTGSFKIEERLCTVNIYCIFNGAITFTTMPGLPVTSGNNLASIQQLAVCGRVTAIDQGTAWHINTLYPYLGGSQSVVTIARATDAVSMSATVPFTWNNTDCLYITISYRI